MINENAEINRFNRNAAFSINLANPDVSGEDSIYCMIELEKRLWIFSEKSITELVPAENIDPNNQEPDTRHGYQNKYPIGTENSFVARTIIQAKEILDSLVLRDGLDKQVILDHVWNCFELLFMCEKSSYNVFDETMKLMSKCDTIIEQNKRKSHIPSLPQLENLEQNVAVFLGYAKRFLEKSHEILCLFYDSPKMGSNFSSYKDWMVSNKSSRQEIANLLEDDQNWIKLISHLRNALDVNHSKPNFKVEIENFKLHAGNKFSNPCWKYDFSEKNGNVQNYFTDIIKDMDVYLYNMLTFFEELFLLSIRDNWNNKMNYEIFKHSDRNINKKCPILYFVSLKKTNILP